MSRWSPLAASSACLMIIGCALGCNAPIRGDWPVGGGTGVLLPEARSSVALALSDVSSIAVDDAGVVWLASRCQGAYAVDGEEIRRYDFTNSGVPEGVFGVAVDGAGRSWFYDDSSATALIGTEWQRVHDGKQLSVSTAPDGSVWLLSEKHVRRLAPGPNRSRRLPEPGTSIAAVSRNSLWLATSHGVYFGEKDRWVGPIANDGALIASPTEPHAILLGTQSHRLEWTGEAIEATKLDLPAARPIGFDRSGRLVAIDDQHLYWISDGGVETSLDLFGFQAPVAALAPDDSVLVATGLATLEVFRVTPSRQGVALRTVPFDAERDYPWRARGAAAALLAPSLDVSAAQLLHPNPQLYDVRLRVQGHIEVGPDSAALVVEGRDVGWPLVTVALDQAIRARGLGLAVLPDDSGRPRSDVPKWEFFGYLEGGQCGPAGTVARQLWITEAYPPTSTQAERDALRAELAATP